ncbi:MAG: hypothetical protein AAGK66_04070 [Pseudomonadota bacterium]
MADGDRTIELFKDYSAKKIYQRELRPYKIRRVGRIKLESPNTDLIKPAKKNVIYGGRTGLLDRKQGTFGYFFGGGWVYGLVENDRFRAEPAGIDEYKTEYNLSPVFRAGYVKGRKLETINWRPGVKIPRRIKRRRYIEVKVDRQAFQSSGHLPRLEDLRQIDTLAVAHDYGLRVLDARAWSDPAYAASSAYQQDKKSVNRELRQGLIAYRDGDFKRIQDDWKKAESRMPRKDWEAFGSLIYYERALFNSAIFFLGFQDGVSGYGARIERVSKAYQSSRLYSYSPPAVQLSTKTLSRVITDSGKSILSRPSHDERVMSNLMYEYYSMEQRRLEQDYLREFKSKD